LEQLLESAFKAHHLNMENFAWDFWRVLSGVFPAGFWWILENFRMIVDDFGISRVSQVRKSVGLVHSNYCWVFMVCNIYIYTYIDIQLVDGVVNHDKPPDMEDMEDIDFGIVSFCRCFMVRHILLN
jgi:hypothetical protein